MSNSNTMENSLRFAVIFSYSGFAFDGLERSKGSNSIESVLLSALASIAGKNNNEKSQISLLNISRSSTTETGEHASRQVLSLEMTCDSPLHLPQDHELNAILPDSIKIYKVMTVPEGFSARRTCEARTYEFLIPTYSFSPPPKEAFYGNNNQESQIDDNDDDDFKYPDHDVLEEPKGGLFQTIKRKLTIKRNASDATVAATEETPCNSPIITKKQNKFAKFWSKLWFGKNVPESVANKRKEDTSSTRPISVNRSKSLHRNNAPAIPLIQPVQLASSPDPHEEGPFGGLISTLKRTMSTKRSRRREEEFETSKPAVAESLNFFEPLHIPWSEEYISELKEYRVTENQIRSLQRIIAVYNGTHNWHNYIPGASHSDPRCYLRILNIELSPPEVISGLEWIRVKVQAKAFARLQVRKMIAFAIMVVRTNTPISVIGNSFGIAKIHLPECPSHGLILDEPHYEEYNMYASGIDKEAIEFDSIKEEIEEFRHNSIHAEIFKYEEKEMLFAKWLRNMDSFSFMYTYFLNSRGVISKNSNRVREVV